MQNIIKDLAMKEYRKSKPQFEVNDDKNSLECETSENSSPMPIDTSSTYTNSIDTSPSCNTCESEKSKVIWFLIIF